MAIKGTGNTVTVNGGKPGGESGESGGIGALFGELLKGGAGKLGEEIVQKMIKMGGPIVE